MSLDVYLTMPDVQKIGSGIFIREDGEIKEVTRAVWDALHPGREPVVIESSPDEVFSANITHNLGSMASEAGIYKYLWRPDEINITKASQLIEPLRTGLSLLKSDPDRFEKFNPSNGWGSYSAFIPWVEKYLNACIEYPDADVRVSR